MTSILPGTAPRPGPMRAGLAVAGSLWPGVLLCLAVTLAAEALQWGEARIAGGVWLEALVLAILVGTAVRTAWSPPKRYLAGIRFCAKTLLEIAVMLLGAAISAQIVVAAGVGLLGGIAAIVVVAILAGYGVGRLVGLPHRMATLVACGNAICGNSAIAAVAPVIGADSRDVAASIAFTAVLGVVVVLALPLAPLALPLSHTQYGVLAGLTVYAVPQVLAATAPIGLVATQMGTLVKLLRVLMLGPVVVCLALLTRRSDAAGPTTRLAWHTVVPWFIVGFVGLAALRSAGLLPQVVLGPMAMVASMLTVISMAALGLGTDLRMVAKAGAAVSFTVCLSLLLLAAMSVALIRLLGIA